MKIVPCLAAEAARILGVTPPTVRLMESRGELSATRTASGVRIFDRADVERLAAERTAKRESTHRTRHIA
jgi:excisionase family DNA binding protein